MRSTSTHAESLRRDGAHDADVAARLRGIELPATAIRELAETLRGEYPDLLPIDRLSLCVYAIRKILFAPHLPKSCGPTMMRHDRIAHDLALLKLVEACPRLALAAGRAPRLLAPKAVRTHLVVWEARRAVAEWVGQVNRILQRTEDPSRQPTRRELALIGLLEKLFEASAETAESEWRRDARKAVRSLASSPNAIGRCEDDVLLELLRLAGEGRLPAWRTQAGRLRPNWRLARDRLGPRSRRRGGRGAAAAHTASAAMPAPNRLGSLSRVEKLELLDRLERLTEREREALTLGLTESHLRLWGRAHLRLLRDSGFRISQPGLLKLGRRVRAKLAT